LHIDRLQQHAFAWHTLLAAGLHHDFSTDNVDRLRHFEHQMSPFNPAGTLGIVVVKRRTDNVGVAFMIPARGRLLPSSDAPVNGEHVEELIHVGDVVIEQIISGMLDEPVDYDQDHDEWVVLLEGEAELEEKGEWVLLPKRTPHRLTRTTQGANWLAVHVTSE
jgi:cupin 2 domain-containing protein